MLVAILGGIVVAVLIAGSVSLFCFASLSVPPKSLTRRWHRETASPRRP
jgi:hypothetical protein